MKNRETIAGVIHVPLLHHTYYAEKGVGAYLNEKKLGVNMEEKIANSSVSVVFGYSTSPTERDALAARLAEHGVKRVFQNWSSAYDFCLLAAGKIEAIINKETDMYDYAAGKLLAVEAGAKITDFNANSISDESSIFVASNAVSLLHNTIIQIIHTPPSLVIGE